MANQAKVIDKKMKKEGSIMVVTEVVETTLDLKALERMLQQNQREKESCISESHRIKAIYDNLVQKEKDIIAMMDALRGTEKPEKKEFANI